MPFSTLGLSVATVGMATLAFAIAAPASAQERYAHNHLRAYPLCARPLSPHRPLWRRSSDHRSFASAGAAPTYALGPVGAVGSVVGGTGQAVLAVFTGAGGIVGGVVGGVFGGVSALFGGPGYTYTPANGYGGPFAAPFNAAGSVAAAPSRWSAALSKGRPPLLRFRRTRPRTATRAAAPPQLGWTVTAISSPAPRR